MAAEKKASKSFSPLGSLVVLEVFRPDRTVGGVMLPEGVDDPHKAPEGLVLATGPNCTWVEVGDVVVLPAVGTIHRLSHCGNRVTVINETQILGISNKEGHAPDRLLARHPELIR